jgi:hypothetical protein
MRMWPISTRVNKPENDDPSIVEPVQLAGCGLAAADVVLLRGLQAAVS